MIIEFIFPSVLSVKLRFMVKRRETINKTQMLKLLHSIHFKGILRPSHINSYVNDDVIVYVCSRGEWSDHRSHHPVSAAARHPRQRPLLPAKERQTPLWAFREARDVSNKPAFISRVKF